jgi:hypothetical protein
MNNRTRCIGLALLLGLASVCSGCGSQGAGAGEPSATSLLENKGELTFFDSSAFDTELSRALRGGVQVVVFPAQPFSPNQIPPRLEKWLSEVSRSGGRVRLERLPAEGAPTRALPGFGEIADALFHLWDVLQERILYSPSDSYDVLMQYRTQGNIERILFTPRMG